MRLHQLALCLAIFCLAYSHCDAKTVFRRTDKISENFKQLNLPAEEIDPNVAPPEPQKIETIDPADVVNSSNGETTATGDESVAEDSVAATNEVLDESVNEIEGAADAVPALAAAAEEAAVEVAEEVAEAATPAAVTTSTTVAPAVNTTESPLSRYCKCSADHCDCCRNFNLPLIPVRGPGCAKITYLGNEKMSVSLKYGDITLATRTISSKNSRPLCVGLPGGYSKFCGRVYGLSRAKDNFKACLGFELRADDEVEAALRVSCFKFGPGGLKVAEAEPFPVNKDEEDEDDDIFGFAAGGDDEDEDEDDYDESDDADEADDADDDSVEDDEPEAPEDADYGGFSLGDFFDDDDDDEPAKPATVAAAVITPPPAVDLTRTATDGAGDAQSKVDKDAGTLPAESSGSDTATTVVAEAATADTSSQAAPTSETTPSKSKKSKKSKKKKAVADVETDFAYELLNGILDFFN